MTEGTSAPGLTLGLPQSDKAPDQVRGEVSENLNARLTEKSNSRFCNTNPILSTVDTP